METKESKLKILILDDSWEDAMLVLASLKQSDLSFEHEHVFDQFEYADSLKKNSPDIILSDYGLRGYNGLMALRDKKELGITCPFIIVTGSLPDEVAVECLRAGVDDYILKDRLSRLPDAVKAALNRQKSDEDRRTAFSELIKSQKRLEAAEKLAHTGNWEWHPFSDSMTWSDEMYSIMGADKRTHVPTIRSFMKLIRSDKDDLSSVILAEVLKGSQSSGEGRMHMRTFDGKEKIIRAIFESSKEPPTDENFRVFGTMQDVTVLHSTEQKLRSLTEELEQRVKERTQELVQTNRMLKRQNEELTDSINYAKLIQNAFLAKPSECAAIFPDSFVLWQPRDIVSGDFYWKHQDERYDYIAVADCTGHGVPGAMMSMIGHQLLNKTVIRERVKEPAEILQLLDATVDEALLSHAEAGVHDGMDIILCRVDKEKKQICYAGAYRPLFHFSSSELMELPGNRRPIGNRSTESIETDFLQHTINYKEGDVIYLTSDGYYSQFGGISDKKIMKTRFKKLLLEVAPQRVEEQHAQLLSFLQGWQGAERQVDDILIIGIRF